MENLPHLILPIKTIVTLMYYAFVIIYAIFTVVFYYHWQHYSMSRGATASTYIAFFGITIPLLALMGLAILAL
jgi:hypothetical protein